MRQPTDLDPCLHIAGVRAAALQHRELTVSSDYQRRPDQCAECGRLGVPARPFTIKGKIKLLAHCAERVVLPGGARRCRPLTAEERAVPEMKAFWTAMKTSFRPIDPDIYPLVRWLNTNGVPTMFSCSGHGHRPPMVVFYEAADCLRAVDLVQPFPTLVERSTPYLLGEAWTMHPLFALDAPQAPWVVPQ